jgi:hypothetical protein
MAITAHLPPEVRERTWTLAFATSCEGEIYTKAG